MGQILWCPCNVGLLVFYLYLFPQFVPIIFICLQSCPVINVYTAENLDRALEDATKNFCKQEVSMFTETDEIWLSKIFQWYMDDFGKTDLDVIK